MVCRRKEQVVGRDPFLLLVMNILDWDLFLLFFFGFSPDTALFNLSAELLNIILAQVSQVSKDLFNVLV